MEITEITGILRKIISLGLGHSGDEILQKCRLKLASCFESSSGSIKREKVAGATGVQSAEVHEGNPECQPWTLLCCVGTDEC